MFREPVAYLQFWVTVALLRQARAGGCMIRLAVALLAGLLLLGGTAAAQDKLATRTGVMVTPKNFPKHDGNDVADMFARTAELGSFAVMRLEWSDANLPNAVRLLTGLAAQRNLAAVVELSPFKAKELIIPPKPGVIAANGDWTPDGKSLIWLSTDNPKRSTEIRRIDLATRRISRIPTPSALMATDPHWLGDKMVFPAKAGPQGADALWLMNIDGSGARQITKPPRTSNVPGLYGDFDPKLSPAGSKVAFMRIDGGESWRVMLLDLASGEEKLLTPKGKTQGLPTWSSDGKLLLYVNFDRRNLKETGLYTMTPEGNERRMLPLPRGVLNGHSSFFPGSGSSPKARIIFNGQRMPGL